MSEELKVEQPLQVTSLESLGQSKTRVEAIPGFEPGTLINVRLKRVSLYDMIASGQIPNELLSVAYAMATSPLGENPVKRMDPEDVTRLGDLTIHIAKTAMVEPSYEQFKEAAGAITDEQLTAIFLYATKGVQALKLFRSQFEFTQTLGGYGKNVGQSAKRLPTGTDDVRSVRT